jgi:hypothetical protein
LHAICPATARPAGQVCYRRVSLVASYTTRAKLTTSTASDATTIHAITDPSTVSSDEKLSD